MKTIEELRADLINAIEQRHALKMQVFELDFKCYKANLVVKDLRREIRRREKKAKKLAVR